MYFTTYLLVGIYVNKIMKSCKYELNSILVFTSICLPITLFLLLFSGISDSSGYEYIPHFFWILSPITGYCIGMLLNKRMISQL